ncbi:trypsin-like peptidase domain-containing protein [Pseudonocardia sp. HH130630-07]|uniref:trypsin-like peptidase domain-containing protein n=1 Tax=Pseudonocardia sp. HH130630-07 TaxID=1690815 RepID=UPI000814D6C4|nr:trypsin-like peptidase domain-containing protein [Pseudonocardia sp. HH130630-07]ANY06133.1 hypothetical protein AFB00_07275 [Pseudonocardia sp. HH130630-07]
MAQENPPDETPGRDPHGPGAAEGGGTGPGDPAPAAGSTGAREGDRPVDPERGAADGSGSGADAAGAEHTAAAQGTGAGAAGAAGTGATGTGTTDTGTTGTETTGIGTTGTSPGTGSAAGSGTAPGSGTTAGAGPTGGAGSTAGGDAQDPPTDRWFVPSSPWARPGGTSEEQAGPMSSTAAPQAEQDPATAAGPVPDAAGSPPAPGTSAMGPVAGDPGRDRPAPPPWAYGAPPREATGAPSPTGPPPPRRSRTTLAMIVGGLVLALVAGAIGGAIGTDIARSSVSGGGVLDSPIPDVDSDLPVTPVEAVAQRVLPSVVQLRVTGGAGNSGGLGEGTGMVISEDGLVLTNNHVVGPAASGGTVRAVFQDGRVATGSIVGQDPKSDVALVQVQLTGLVPVEFANSDGVRVGQQVTAIGSPLGLGGSVTTGIVSALDRAVSIGGEAGGPDTVFDAIQTDAAINPGNSGGPLVDAEGRVVGINSAIATAGPGGGSIGVGFSIPVNQARRIADQLRTGRPATHAVLGVEVTDDPQFGGAVVRTVTPGGAAEQAGLRPDDLVQRVGDRRIETGADLQAAVHSQPPGSVVDLQLRDRSVQVTLGEQ